jgi:DNA-directed RNA polymerase II subunit RPB1
MLGICNKVVVEEISPYRNNIYKMIWAKSKGSETNLTQIIATLANQNVDGRRIPEGFTKRTLPHFCKDDRSPEPRGFVYSSFYTGLGPHEFFFHSMGGREGLSDTAVKTARTGYIQRKLIKALEDVIVKYDGTVRDSQNNLIQLMYGEDGFAAEFIEKQVVTLDETEEKFKADYRWDWEELANTYGIGEEGIEMLEEEFSTLSKTWKSLKDQFMPSEGNKDIYCPIKVDRLINNIKQKEGKSKPSQDLSPLYVCQEVEKLLDICVHPQYQNEYKKLLISDRSDQLERSERDIKLRKQQFEKESGIELFRNVIRIHLSSKKICKMHCLTRNGFVAVVELIKAKFTQALINPGEAIGAIAAQCVGEPTTQMTLNTFHSAGIKASNVTLGVPRLQELVEVSRNMKTTSLKIYLEKSEKDYRRYVKELPEMYLGDFIVGCKIYYDYGSRNTAIENKDITDEISSQEETSQKVTPWLMVLTLDSGLHLSSDIKDKIKESLIALTERFSRMTRRHSQ